MDARAWVDTGSGLAGVTFYDGVGTVLTSSGVRLTATTDSSVEAAMVAPPGAHFAALWAGKWAGSGELQVAVGAFNPGTCSLLIPAKAAARYADKLTLLQVAGLHLGTLLSGPLHVDCSVRWRTLSPSGPGMNTNYLMDLSPEWRNGGGPTYVQSMQVRHVRHRLIGRLVLGGHFQQWVWYKQAMGVSSLRYPGGEEANTFQWAPPPYTNQTTPKPVLTTPKGFPGGDFLFYNQISGTFQYSVMNFDQLMGLASELGVAAVYIVLNHDSVNVGGQLGLADWSNDDLKAAAVAWASYIVRKGYMVRLLLSPAAALPQISAWNEGFGTAGCFRCLPPLCERRIAEPDNCISFPLCLQARHFELSNESWKTNQAAQYAWALLDWAPALKHAYPAALMGANGPSGQVVGNMDQGVGWWQQVVPLGDIADVFGALQDACSPQTLKLTVQVLGAASSAIDFLAVHPYPVYGWDYLDYVNGQSSNLQASPTGNDSCCPRALQYRCW